MVRNIDKQKLINKVLNPDDKNKEDLSEISKNMLIRNVIQHRNNTVDSYILKNRGLPYIEVLDETGNLKQYVENDKIVLSIPEIISLRGSIFKMISVWRESNE